MPDVSDVPAYPFPKDLADSEYRLFPDDIEDNRQVFFHGTNAANLNSILQHGLTHPSTIASVSYSETSPLALRYACEKRTIDAPEGCVIAFEFPDLSLPVLVQGGGILHAYQNTNPITLGYCRVPADYEYR